MELCMLCFARTIPGFRAPYRTQSNKYGTKFIPLSHTTGTKKVFDEWNTISTSPKLVAAVF